MTDRHKVSRAKLSYIIDATAAPVCIIAPKLFGGANAKTPIEGMGTDSPAHAVMLGSSKVTKLGDDFLIECDVV